MRNGLCAMFLLVLGIPTKDSMVLDQSPIDSFVQLCTTVLSRFDSDISSIDHTKKEITNVISFLLVHKTE